MGFGKYLAALLIIFSLFIPLTIYAESHTIQEPQWSEGDILTASSTIVGLFGIGFFAITRFESKGRIDAIMTSMRNAFVLIGIVEALHLSILGVVVVGLFDPGFYLIVILATIVCILLVFYYLYSALDLENQVHKDENIKSKELIDKFH